MDLRSLWHTVIALTAMSLPQTLYCLGWLHLFLNDSIFLLPNSCKIKQKDAYCHVKGIFLLLNTRLFARPNTTYGKKKRRIFNVTMSQNGLCCWFTDCYMVTLVWLRLSHCHIRPTVTVVKVERMPLSQRNSMIYIGLRLPVILWH